MEKHSQSIRMIYTSPLQSRVVALLTIVWLTCMVFGWMAASQAVAGQSQQVKGLSRATAASSDLYDENSLAPEKRKEWATVLEKLAGENIDCMEDCGTGFACQDKCWDVYNFQLDREYQRLVYEGQK